MDSSPPVLLLGFNRPELLEDLISSVRRARPKRVYLAVDGPRRDHPADVEAVGACQELAGAIDWGAEVSVRFADVNQGCGRAVSGAISWMFETEDEGIILEDDIDPDPSFFPFCSELLARYANDSRVLAISGSNVVPSQGQTHPEMPYRFSVIPHVWGWATWRRSWQRYQWDCSDWRAQITARTLWERTGGSLTGSLMWAGYFEMVATGQWDTWDIQLVLSAMRTGQLTATSNTNLTRNRGFDESATHVTTTPMGVQPVAPVQVPVPGAAVEWDSLADAWARQEHFQAGASARQAMMLTRPYFREFVNELRQCATS